jgi:hypothetical protein
MPTTRPPLDGPVLVHEILNKGVQTKPDAEAPTATGTVDRVTLRDGPQRGRSWPDSIAEMLPRSVVDEHRHTSAMNGIASHRRRPCGRSAAIATAGLTGRILADIGSKAAPEGNRVASPGVPRLLPRPHDPFEMTVRAGFLIT